MALKSGNTIAAADFNNLKSRIDAECRKRNGTGSVYSLPDNSSYKYVASTSPLKDRKAIQEHYSKIVNQISYIKTLSDTNLPNYKRIDYNALNKVSSEISTLEGFTKGSANDFAGKTGCKSSCTGLCYTSCTDTCRTGCTSCTGCTDQCTSCQGTCYNICTGCTNECTSCSGCTSCTGCTDKCTSCTNDCAKNCTSCKGYCTVTCGEAACQGSCTSCSGTCSNTCTHACSPATCMGTCVGGCYMGCSSCSGTCVGTSVSTCSGCSGTCLGTCFVQNRPIANAV